MDHIHLHHYNTIFVRTERTKYCSIYAMLCRRAHATLSRRAALLKSQLYHVRKGLNCTGLQLRDFSATLFSP